MPPVVTSDADGFTKVCASALMTVTLMAANSNLRYHSRKCGAFLLMASNPTKALQAALTVAVLTTNFTGAVAQPAPIPKDITIQGVGAYSCGRWTTSRRDNIQSRVDAQWLLGFVSGAAAYGAQALDPAHGLDRDAILVWTDNYCSTHPLETLFDAAVAFVTAHPH
jgi:hypothetical protein